MPVTEPAGGPIRALLIDDHALFRQSVAQSLAQDPNLRIEHCASIRDALTLLSQQLFDLVLIGDVVAITLAANEGVDPGPIPVLEDLKIALARG